MKKLLLVSMLVLSSLSFAARGDKGSEGGDFYSLYNSAYEASGNPTMHKELGIEDGEVEKVKSIINNCWYNLKVLEADKLKEVFAVDMLLVDGEGNRDKIKGHMSAINDINVKMDKEYNDMKAKLGEIMDVDKLK